MLDKFHTYFKIDKIRKALNEGGITLLIFRTYKYIVRLASYCFVFIWKNSIRRILPYTGYQTYNNVKIRRRKPADGILGIYRDKPSYEENYTELIRSNVSEGDKVIVVGGWYGVSSIAAAKLTGEQGLVVTYEATKKGAERVRDVAELNDVSEIIDVRNRVVGCDVKQLQGESELTDEYLDSSDLEADDVLAIDCDGCEFNLLENLSSSPEIIIVEHHGAGEGQGRLSFEYDEEKLKDILDSKGYEVHTFEVRNRQKFGYEDKIGWFTAFKED